jgi:hypothetical protein
MRSISIVLALPNSVFPGPRPGKTGFEGKGEGADRWSYVLRAGAAERPYVFAGPVRRNISTLCGASRACSLVLVSPVFLFHRSDQL